MLLTLLRGLLGAASITCFYLAIELLPLQDAVTLFFCSPVVASLLEFAVTGESHGWAGAAATACTVLGVVLLSQPECVFHHGDHGHHMPGSSGTSVAGVALATCAAVTNAAAFVVVRLIDQSQSTLVLTWWYHGVVVVVSAVPLALGYPAPAVVPSKRGALLLAVVGVTQFLGQLLLNRGFQLESATRGSAINVLQVLFSFVWDVLVLGDKPGPVGVTGSSLVAAGVIFMAAKAKPPPPSSHHPGSAPHPARSRPGDISCDPEQPDTSVLAAASVPLLLHRSSGSIGCSGGWAVDGGGTRAGSVDPEDASDWPAPNDPGQGEHEPGRPRVVVVQADATTLTWLRSRRGPNSRRGSTSGGGAGADGSSGAVIAGPGADGEGGAAFARQPSDAASEGAALQQPLLVQSSRTSSLQASA